MTMIACDLLRFSDARFRAMMMIFLVSLFSAPALRADDRQIAAVFERRGVEGTLVICSLDGTERFVHNAGRARIPYPVASTFKILNTLIALQEGAVRGRDEVIRWDGTEREFPDWNRDQTLSSAFRSSCVWYYQELARRIGETRYRRYLEACRFGQLSGMPDSTTFWLDGSLLVSAEEQVEFLRKVCRRTLPFDNQAWEILRDLMVVVETPRYILRAKSGWAARSSPQVGWYVGYVERGERVWLFALNMEISCDQQLPLRREITLEALHAKGIVD